MSTISSNTWEASIWTGSTAGVLVGVGGNVASGVPTANVGVMVRVGVMAPVEVGVGVASDTSGVGVRVISCSAGVAVVSSSDSVGVGVGLVASGVVVMSSAFDVAVGSSAVEAGVWLGVRLAAGVSLMRSSESVGEGVAATGGSVTTSVPETTGVSRMEVGSMGAGTAVCRLGS